MATADNVTIRVAAEVGQAKPNMDAEIIARVVGKLIKVCNTILKCNKKQEEDFWIGRAEALAREIDCEFDIRIADVDGSVRMELKSDTRRIEI